MSQKGRTMKNLWFDLTTGKELEFLTAICFLLIFVVAYDSVFTPLELTPSLAIIIVATGVLMGCVSFVLTNATLKMFNLYHRTLVYGMYLKRGEKCLCYRLKIEGDGTPITMIGWLNISDSIGSDDWHPYANDKANIIKAAKIVYNDTDTNITEIDGVAVEGFRAYAPSDDGIHVLRGNINYAKNPSNWVKYEDV
jgi:hypothetical protein